MGILLDIFVYFEEFRHFTERLVGGSMGGM